MTYCEARSSISEEQTGVKSRGWAKRIFHLDPKSSGKEMNPFVEEDLKDGALDPIKGIR